MLKGGGGGGGGGSERGIFLNDSDWETPPIRRTFSRLQIFYRVRNLTVRFSTVVKLSKGSDLDGNLLI